MQEGYPQTFYLMDGCFGFGFALDVKEEAKTAQEILDSHNAFLLANFNILTETEGGTDYLTDENGVYQYE